MSHTASATVTRRFEGVQDGHVYPRWFEVGETITGDLAVAMASCGFASDPDAEPPGPAPLSGEGQTVEPSADGATATSATTGGVGEGQGTGEASSDTEGAAGAVQSGSGAPSSDQSTNSDGNSASPASAPEPPLEPKHVGRGTWWLVRGEARVKGPFDSKEDAVAALEEKGA